MRPIAAAILMALLLLAGTKVPAEPVTIGKDVYLGGEGTVQTPRAMRDLFAAGMDVILHEPVDVDAHVAGMSVRVEAPTGGDLYALGGNVRIDAPVSGDMSATGFSLYLERAASVGGNARLSGGSVRIAAPLAGALLVSGGSIYLDARVEGDAWLAGRDITFGPGAAVAGTLHIAGPDGIVVPDTVAPQERVVFEVLDKGMPMRAPDWAPGWIWDAKHEWPRPNAFFLLGGSILTLAFLVAIGAAALALAPERTETLRSRLALHPWLSLLWGILGLSATIGLVPVAAMTLIGIPLVPIVVLATVVLWIFGYLLGVYALAMALLAGVTGPEAVQGLGRRLGALATGLVIAAVLNFVPLLGWMANLVLVLLGIGAMVQIMLDRLAPHDRPAAALPDEQ